MAELVLPHSIDAGTAITANEVQGNFDEIADIVNGQLSGGSGADGNIAAGGITARELTDNLLKYGIPASNLQEGVVASGDLKVTPGSNLVLNYASGTAWVTDDSGVLAAGALLPVVVTGSSATIAANSSGNPRIDQIILTMTGHATGTVSILQGTATGGATLDNRTGAASLPNDAVRLADILMPNGFAGPFVQNTHIRDRRPWARGAYYNAIATDYAAIPGASTWVTVSTVRLEVSGNPITMNFSCGTGSATAASQNEARLLIDGVVPTGFTSPTTHSVRVLDAAWAYQLSQSAPATPTAGSHVFSAQVQQNTGSTLSVYDPTLEVIEHVRQNSENAGA